MLSATIRVYGVLNDFLPPARRQTSLSCQVAHCSVKDLVESLGVPHPEIGLLVVNGSPADFATAVRDGDRVAAYPPFVSIDPGASVRLDPPPLAEPRFVADVHLGRLAAYLRLAGLDTAYRTDSADRELVELSAREDRTLLTRDVGVLKHRAVSRGYFVRATQPARQLVEILRRFDLVGRAAPFSRCLRCNGPLRAVAKDSGEALLPPRTRAHYRAFSSCSGCGQVYWEGSHFTRMTLLLETAFAAVRTPSGG
jgi:uncharacterized protein with PIN domain